MRWASGVLVIALVSSATLSGCFFDSKNPGSAAKDFLSSVKPKLIVEIDSQSGKQLSSSAVDLLRTRIGERLDKPGGVTYQQNDIAIASKTRWSVDDLKDAEKANRDHKGTVDTASLYVLVVGGGFEADNNDGKVLGVAYSPSAVAIFKDNIQNAAGVGGIPLFSTTDVERAVLVHEFGHLLGLVNIGIKMQSAHEDGEHPGHSNNKGSVMFWAVESDAISRIFNGPPPTQFDANDIADMRAAGGK